VPDQHTRTALRGLPLTSVPRKLGFLLLIASSDRSFGGDDSSLESWFVADSPLEEAGF
jgi:hypothetical protein